MSDLLSYPSAPLIIALTAGYILGALPVAERISRLNGVDIFGTGTGLAGASNVLRNVGRVPAAVVMVGDMAKGALAVIVAHLLGLEGVWVLAPASAAIAGHWKSVFSGFRGGDGLAVLAGVTIAVIPSYGVISVLVGGLVALGGRVFPYTSLLSVVSAFLALVSLSLAYYGDTAMTVGIGIMACVVLSYAVLGHARRKRTGEWSIEGERNGLADPDGVAEPDSAT